MLKGKDLAGVAPTGHAVAPLSILTVYQHFWAWLIASWSVATKGAYIGRWLRWKSQLVYGAAV